MWKSKASLLCFLVAIVAWCQADSFLIGNRINGVRPKHLLRNIHGVAGVQQLKVVAQVRGGGVYSSTKSMWEALPQGSLSKGLANVIHSFVDPAITGGLLSGGLHAVTGILVRRSLI